MPESGRTVLPLSFLMSAISSAVSGLPLLELAAEVEVLGVLADDHEVDRRLREEGPDAAIDLAGPDAGIEVEGLPEVDVHAPESGADRRGDRCLEGHLGAPARLDHAVGDGRSELGHDIDAGILLVPADGDTRRLDAQLRGFGELRPDTVAADERHFIRHQFCISPGIRGACATSAPPRPICETGHQSLRMARGLV